MKHKILKMMALAAGASGIILISSKSKIKLSSIGEYLLKPKTEKLKPKFEPEKVNFC